AGVEAINAAGVEAINAAGVEAINAAGVEAINAAGVEAINAAGVEAINAAGVEAINAAGVEAINAAGVEAINAAGVEAINAAGVDAINAAGVEAINAAGVEAINAAGVDAINAAGVEAINAAGVDAINAAGVEAINAAGVEAINAAGVEAINAAGVEAINAGGVKAGGLIGQTTASDVLLISLGSAEYEVSGLALINSSEANNQSAKRLSSLEPIALAPAQFAPGHSQVRLMGRAIDIHGDAGQFLGKSVIVLGVVSADHAIPVLVGTIQSPALNGVAFVQGPIEQVDPVYGRLIVGGFSVGYTSLMDGVFAPGNGDYIEIRGISHAAGMSATR
ncbi:MAG: hypothetical protein AAGM16_15200, partial [Pseudomonadota bacterium]